ncbi:hypothetical protein AYO47_06450 [Planctomyces sp. SCGC AG-212-M04]|nr:hypothetical protein AYO47_06450 [Planctomyces sp. SCGC AG-212-M04]
MGDVYLAHDTQLSRKVALKVPKLIGADADELLERFYREAHLAATVRNPYLCPVYDVGEIGGIHYIAMAFIEGKPLSEIIKSSGKQKQRAALILVRKVAVALQEAHSAGIIHRDLKPANIMIDTRGEPVVMDFGLAFQADEDRARLTESGTILGSPAYMSPEQLDGSRKITQASDQFSLGVVLYEMLTGELPFRGSISAIANQIVNGAPPSPSRLRPDLDPKIEQLCLKLLAKKPAARFPSMQDVAQSVATALKSESAPAQTESDSTASALVASPSASVQKQVEKLLSWGELVSALEVLEADGAKLTGKQADWARQKRAEIRTQIEHWKNELSAQCRLGRQLISKHDYAEAVNILSTVPVGVRDAELTSLLESAKEQAEEVEQLLKDIERAFRTGTDEELNWLVKRFLQLKPGHQRMKALAADLKRYGPERVIQKRRKQKDFLDPAGRIWEPTHFLYYAAGLAVACGLVYVATIMFQSPKGTVAIEVLDPTISIDFLQQQVSTGNSGQSFQLKAGEKQMLAVRLGGDLVPDWTQDLSVERNETKRIAARLVDGNVELTINSEKKVFSARRPSEVPAAVKGTQNAVLTSTVSPATDEWIDLLASVNAASAGGSIMEWARVEGVLTGKVKAGVDLAWVALTPPVDFGGDYDLEVEYLAEGGNYVSVAFPLNETTLALSIFPTGCGLQWIDGNAFKAPDAATDPKLRPGVLQKLAISVRHSGPEVTIITSLDGTPAARFSGLRSRLEVPKAAVPAPGNLRIVCPISKPRPSSRIEVRTARFKKSSSSPAVPVARSELQKTPIQPQSTQTAGDFIIDADFRKSSAGINQADQDFILEEYKQGEFRYLGKKPGWWYAPFHKALWRDENNNLRNFAVEFDIRIPTPKKGEFGVEFGRLGDHTLTLCFNQLGQVRLLSAGQNLVQPTSSPALKPVDQFNTVRMEVLNRTITVAVNDVKLFDKKLERLGGRHVNPWLYVDEFPFDVRLQRFRLERLGTREPRQFDGAIRRFEGHTEAIRGVAFLPDGKQAVSVSNDATLKLWDVPNGKLVHSFPGHTAAVTSVCLSGDGKRAITGCDDGIVRLWDLEGRELVKALKGHTAAVTSVLISKEGLIGYSASKDGSIRRWDLKTFSKPAVLPGPGGDATLVYSPDEKVIAASAMDGSIAMRGQKAAGSILGNDPGPIRAMTFTPDGTKLIAAGCVSTLRVWDVSNGKQIHSFEGDDAGFASVAVTKDGKHVVAGCRDSTIRAWNLETGDPVLTIRAPVPVTYRMALSPDNEFVLSGGDGNNRSDNALRLWHLPRL